MVAQTNETVDLLAHLGLSPDESRVYLHLLASGVQRGAEVAKGTRLSRPRAYRALTDLVMRGIATSRSARPRAFEAAPPETLFQQLRIYEAARAEKRRAITDVLETRLRSVVPKEAPTENAPVLDQLRGRPAVHGRLLRMANAAEREFLLYLTHPLAHQLTNRDFVPLVNQGVARGVKFRMLMSRNMERSRVLAEYRHQVDARFFDSDEMRVVVIVDRRQCMVDLVTDPRSQLGAEGTLAFYTDSPAFAGLQGDFFDAMWKLTPPAQDQAGASQSPELGTARMA